MSEGALAADSVLGTTQRTIQSARKSQASPNHTMALKHITMKYAVSRTDGLNAVKPVPRMCLGKAPVSWPFESLCSPVIVAEYLSMSRWVWCFRTIP